MDIIDNICKKLNIEKIRSNISPIDNIKITEDIIDSNSIIISTIKENINKSKYNNPEMQFLLNNIVDNKYKKFILLMNNHYVNLFLDVNFVLGNVYLFIHKHGSYMPKQHYPTPMLKIAVHPNQRIW